MRVFLKPTTQAFLGELVFHPSPQTPAQHIPFPCLVNHIVLSKLEYRILHALHNKEMKETVTLGSRFSRV